MRQILFPPLRIVNSYVSLIQNKIFFGTIRRILTLTNLAVTSWAFSCFLSPWSTLSLFNAPIAQPYSQDACG